MLKEQKASQTSKFRFTENRIIALPTPPKGKRKFYHDIDTHGFCVCVTGSGSKTFYVYRKVDGRPEYFRIGKYPDYKPNQARKRAAEINTAIDSGTNPNELKRSRRAEMTLGELFNEYMEGHSKLHNKRPEGNQSNYKLYLSHWSNRKLSSISRVDVNNLLKRLGKNKGKVTANHAVKLLRAVYNKAAEWGWWSGENPAQRTKLFSTKPRERYLNDEEMPRFFQAVQEEPDEVLRDLIFMALYTGARRGNLQEMRWQDVDLNKGAWRIPETKNGTPHTILLADEAIAILSRRKLDADSQWVFPGTGKTGHIVEPKRAFAHILKRAGIEDFRFHDLRHTLASWMAGMGISLHTIGKQLGHKNPSSTYRYSHLQENPVREAGNKAVNEMFKIGNVTSIMNAHSKRKQGNE